MKQRHQWLLQAHQPQKRQAYTTTKLRLLKCSSRESQHETAQHETAQRETAQRERQQHLAQREFKPRPAPRELYQMVIMHTRFSRVNSRKALPTPLNQAACTKRRALVAR